MFDNGAGERQTITTGHSAEPHEAKEPSRDSTRREALDLSVVIPCFNEAEIVADHLRRVLELLRASPWRFEILVADDASSDDSADLAMTLGAPEVRVLRYRDGPSRRENLALALREAAGEIVAYMDMDLSSGLDRFDELVRSVAERRCDIAVGSRYLADSVTKRSPLRAAYSRAYNISVRWLFGSRVRDHQCGFKAMRRQTCLRLLDEMGYDGTFRRGWFWDAELLVRAQRAGLRVLEVPVHWAAARQSSFRLGQEIRVIRYMLENRARLRRGGSGSSA